MTDREKAFWIIGEIKGDSTKLAYHLVYLDVPLEVFRECLKESTQMLTTSAQSISSSTEANR